MNATSYLKEQLHEMRKVSHTEEMKRFKEETTIIGFAGRDGAGKSTLAGDLIESDIFNWTYCSFANEIRIAIKKMFEIFLASVHQQTLGAGMEPPRIEPDWVMKNKPLVRELMRTFGTDTIRNKIGDDYWIMLIQNNYFYRPMMEKLEEDKLSVFKVSKDLYRRVYIFDDIRFKNELEWIRSFKNHIVFYCREDNLTKEDMKMYAQPCFVNAGDFSKEGTILQTPKVNGLQEVIKALLDHETITAGTTQERDLKLWLNQLATKERIPNTEPIVYRNAMKYP